MTSQYLLASNDDNVAIVTREILPGESLSVAGENIINHSKILQGHRICVRSIQRGASLISWGLPFGTALCDIAPGDYICNAFAKRVLLVRNPDDYDDSLTVNFADRDTVAAQILPEKPNFGHNRADINDGLTFQGYFRGHNRGWGTRNYMVLIGVTSQARAAVLAACEQLQAQWPAGATFDGVVPIVHTEGGGRNVPNNYALLLRTLAGFATNPNVGAAILVNASESQITELELEAALAAKELPEEEYRLGFHQMEADNSIDKLVQHAATLIPAVRDCLRQPAPLHGLRLGLQCGGSDAFSGVTANQVLGKCVQQLIRRGGTANLAETDELIGAEQYVLQNVASQKIFDRFLAMQKRFKANAAAHGQNAEGNVSGGNLYRGLYNITLKSIGAARKKDPATYIDHIIEYGEPMRQPGYYFMDSPGSDLESIAGQVASGANVILFTTGNGSITNFPFVPTLKIVTTQERFQLLESDMDFDAGQVLNGESFERSASRLFELLIRTAGGQRSKGERTGQYQTQIWRDAYFPQELDLEAAQGKKKTNPAEPLIPAAQEKRFTHDLIQSAPSVTLILPTSLCSGQVAEQIAGKLNGTDKASERNQVVAVAHTEGCAVSGGDAEVILSDTLIGYATHPLVDYCVFLEHGCEKTHNDFFRQKLSERGIDNARFGWASIQQEGGIEAVSRHVTELVLDSPSVAPKNDDPVLVGMASGVETVSDQQAHTLTQLVRQLLQSGIGVVISSNDALLTNNVFRHDIGLKQIIPTVRYAAKITRVGLHVMDSSSSDWLETATGLGATGCRCLIMLSARTPLQAHRFIPTLQVLAGNTLLAGLAGDFDSYGLTEGSQELFGKIIACLAGKYIPRIKPSPNVGFQISRGRYGVSL
ncbi:UxaA family hydrolase [Yersinia enterocolitica]|nr:UxaA family hydrolase [Yersinia enterocolitica]